MRYQDIDAINISTLKAAWSRSPLHYHHGLTHPRATTDEMVLGTATHVRILQPDTFDGLYLVKPAGLNLATKEGKAWKAEHADETRAMLTVDQVARIEGMAAAVAAHQFARQWLEAPGIAEHPITWTDEETGLACKGRLDLWTRQHSLVGLKTARSIDARTYYRQAAQLGYHLQWAFYFDGLCALGTEPRDVVEVVVESNEPFDVAVDIIGEDTLDEGRSAYREALTLVARCRELGEWPGLAPKPRMFQLPTWALSADDDDCSDLDFGEKGGEAA